MQGSKDHVNLHQNRNNEWMLYHPCFLHSYIRTYTNGIITISISKLQYLYNMNRNYTLNSLMKGHFDGCISVFQGWSVWVSVGDCLSTSMVISISLRRKFSGKHDADLHLTLIRRRFTYGLPIYLCMYIYFFNYVRVYMPINK